MGSLIVVLIPVFIICGGAALLISSFVRHDTAQYDMENLWEDQTYSEEDYHL